jgi:hypothetical protein
MVLADVINLIQKLRMAESFILGLSSGSACLLTCGMVMFPYLMAGSAGVRRVTADIAVFLLARLLVYFIIATLVWYSGQKVLSSPVFRTYISGTLYIIFAVMLVWYSLKRNQRRECPAAVVSSIENRKLIPIILGIVNSIGLCPALLIMLTSSVTQETIVKSWLVFLAFFTGSSLWFVPVPLAGKINKKETIQKIGIFATGLAGIIFIVKGITILIGGFVNG